MNRPDARSSLSSTEQYVDSALGLRVFFFTVALACVAGLSLRLYFHPARVKSLLENAVGGEGARIGLKFQSARLSLAHGSIPHIAVEVGGIEINPAHDCRPEPSVRISKLFLPLDVTKLIQFKLALGTIASEGIEVDLDALKMRCPAKSQGNSGRVGAPRAPAGEPVPTVAVPPAADTSEAGPAVAPWWSAEQLEAVRERVGGFEFSRVTVLFEEATKKVYLESFELEAGMVPGSLRLATKLVIPPELTYDERLPVLKIEALAVPTSAEVNVRAALSEGNLSVKGRLLAAPGGFLDADLQAAVGNVPLSTLVPLLTKSGVIKGAFRPRFMWMDCQASIRGRFQGLFVENPLKLSECEIVGKGAKIRIGEAVRKPDGAWQPFVVSLANLDLAQIMDTFDWHGLDGVVSEYGRFDGEFKVSGKDSFELKGDIKGARAHFLSRNEHTDQLIKRMHVQIETNDGRASGRINHVDVDQGTFDGELAFDSFDRGREGTIRGELKTLRLSESVQKVLFAGQLEEISGGFHGKFADRKVVQGTAKILVRGLSGKDVRVPEASFKLESAEMGTEVHFQARAPQLEIRKESHFFRGLASVFFNHEFTGDWIRVEEAKLNSRILTPAHAKFDNNSASWLSWEAAQGTLENRRIHLSSGGGMSRGYDIEGWIGVDYPNLRRLKWQLSGKFDKPLLQADTRANAELQSKGSIDDARLGLAAKKSARE